MKKTFLVTLFAVYLLVVAAITIVPTRIARLRNPVADHVNLVPFSYSFNCFKSSYWPNRGLISSCLMHTLGNILLFMPFGILLPLVTSRFRTLARVMIVAMCLSFAIETIQLISRFIGSPRAVDIDDVVLNTLGACVGFTICKIGRSITGEKGKRGKG